MTWFCFFFFYFCDIFNKNLFSVVLSILIINQLATNTRENKSKKNKKNLIFLGGFKTQSKDKNNYLQRVKRKEKKLKNNKYLKQ